MTRAGLPEIAAPAGGAGALGAALACGADAVYLGVGALNARRNAENFETDQLPDLVSRCHIKGVKVYLTLNTVVRDDECSLFAETARAVCAAGGDSMIVQDLGGAALLRRCAPTMRLTASTQMAVHNADGARMLADMGFSRIVAARECSRQELAEIVRAVPHMEVEAFVHGALCMCISGQCYLSSVLGQRSGNRGLCAQPCRLPFRVGTCENALSLKDMSLIDRMQELRETGVASLKIEGRMKRPEYVAAAVTACRAALRGEQPDLESLQAVFSRSGFTNGYFDGTLGAEMFGTRQKEDVTAAVNVLGKLENLYIDPRKMVQKVETDFAFSMHPNTPAQLTVTDCDGNCVTVAGEIAQAARNKPTDAARAAQSLGKTGGTPYLVRGMACEVTDGLMLPASAINALRREALEGLDELRGKTQPIPFLMENRELPGHQPPAMPTVRVRATHAEQVVPEMLQRAELITLPISALLELCKNGVPEKAEKLCVGVPRILFAKREEVCGQLEFLRENGIIHAAVGNPGALKLAAQFGFTLHGEPFFNVMNALSASALAGWGLTDAMLSFELSLDAAKKLVSPIPVGITGYGKLPLMTVRNCPVRAFVGCADCKAGRNQLVDRKGEAFETSCAYGCCELLNPMPLYMGDRLKEFSGLDFVELRFTSESKRECAEIFEEYFSGGEPYGKFTRGLLYKTIL